MFHEDSKDQYYYPKLCSYYRLLRTEGRTSYAQEPHVAPGLQVGHQGSTGMYGAWEGEGKIQDSQEMLDLGLTGTA